LLEKYNLKEIIFRQKDLKEKESLSTEEMTSPRSKPPSANRKKIRKAPLLTCHEVLGDGKEY